MRRHAGAWLAWYAGALLVASSTVHPAVTVGVIAAAMIIVLAASERTERGAFRVMVILGVAFIALRVVLFTMTGRAGATTLVQLPEVVLPGVLGGVRFGGRLSAEVAVNELAEGLRLCAILLATGAFVTVCDVVELVRLAPARLRRAGVVVQIAVSFLPALAASVREVREAQRARGLRARGLRSAVPLIVPVVAGALDRACLLAESLHARGFDRPDPSRFRHHGWRPGDTRMLGCAVAASVFGVIAARSPAGSWSPHPVLAWPQAAPILLAAPVLLMLPVWLAARNDRAEGFA